MPILSRLARRHAARLIAAGRRAEAVRFASADPVTASRLGMHRLALRGFAGAPPRSRSALRAYAASAMACGRLDLDALLAAPGGDRAGLAAELAQVAPDAAARLRPADVRLRAALDLRLGRPAAALDRLAGVEGPEADLLRIDALTRQGDLDQAAALWRAVFAASDLAPPSPRDASFPLGPTNVVAPPPEPVDGPLVTVILPVRNVEGYVRAAVRSILAQSWRNLELLVVDDASDDATVAAVRAEAGDDPRVELILRDRQAGPYRARNVALERARGEYVCFKDGDDWSHPERIARQIAFLERHRLVAASARHVRVDPDGRPYARQLTPLVRWCPSSLLFRREPVLSTIGCFDEVLTGADSEYWARLALGFGADRVRISRDLLVIAAQRSTSLTGSADTGYAGGFSRARLLYWEAWHFWHARCRRRGVVPAWFPGQSRAFPAPSAIGVDPR